MTMASRELFELCKQVYEATGWGGLEKLYCTICNEVVPNETSIEDNKTHYSVPLYNSDYLLEKLPKEIDRCLLNGRHTFDWSFGYGSGLYFRNHSGSGDTPLKALLKLTLKLHEEGLL